MGIETCSTVDEVIAALGGAEAVCALIGHSVEWSAQNRANWVRVGSFPPRTCSIMVEELRKRGVYAPMTLWRQGCGGGRSRAIRKQHDDGSALKAHKA